MEKYINNQKALELLWCKFFKISDDKEIEELAKEDSMFEEAFNEVKRISGDREIIELARQREMALTSYYMEMHAREKEGEARGRAEGEARGRAEGEARALFRLLKVRNLQENMGIDQFVEEYANLGVDKLSKACDIAEKAQNLQEVLDFLSSS
jgi:hypothetical protein